MANTPENNTTKIADSANQGGMSMWPSLGTASWLYDLANFGLIIGLVVGVISTVLVVWMGNVKEEYFKDAANALVSVLEEIGKSPKLELQNPKNAKDNKIRLNIGTKN